MLGDLVIVLVPALLAFAAAVFGSLLAYRQWRGQRRVERNKGFDADRAAAYKELWTRLEAVHVRLRSIDVRDDEFDASLRDLNSFILGSEIYFEPGIRTRAADYLEAVREVATIVKSAPPDVREKFDRTDALFGVVDMDRLTQAYTAAEEARSALMAEVRANIGGDAP